MTRRNRTLRTVALGLFGLLIHNAVAHAQQSMRANGWHTWSVEAVTDAPQACCYQWQSDKPSVVPCDLQATHFSYGNSDEFVGRSDRIQVYALRESGAFTKARALSPNCPVKSSDKIFDLGQVANADSVSWLSPLIAQKQRLAGDALAAIALHDGNEAGALLESAARSNARFETRKNAVFWIGQARVKQSGALLRELMTSDKSKALRKHAVFSYAQSKAVDRESALIDIVETQSISYEERRNALFWLVQTESPKAIDYIQELLAGQN